VSTPYQDAAAKYRPQKTETLFVAEAPPLSVDRYFYFENVKGGDWLWIALMKALFQDFGLVKLEREQKPIWLDRFKERGCQLIDAVKHPIGGTPSQRIAEINLESDALVSEVREIDPVKIVLIKATVYHTMFAKFRKSGLPVLDIKLPFPGSGRQKEFHDKFPHGI
jgi:hypothetical protein